MMQPVGAGSAGLGTGDDWRAAADEALRTTGEASCDLALVFASWQYAPHFGELLDAVRERLSPRVLVGSSGQAIIATGTEVEDEPALSVLSLSLPGAELEVTRLEHGDFQALRERGAWRQRLGPAAESANAFLVLADPFTFQVEALLDVLNETYPGVPVIGGMASGEAEGREARLFHGDDVLYSGALLISLGGDWTVRPLVSQGAGPIGLPWTITSAEGNVVRELGGRTPLEVLVDTVRVLPAEEQPRVSRNLLVGLAIDEYRASFGRGDFLIRNLLGIDRESGSIEVGALPRVGQTLQFQVRDATAASEELTTLLSNAHEAMAGVQPAGALLCSCNGRGSDLFGTPGHDAGAVRDQFGDLPVAGFFCNGEIGPVGEKNFVHGFTASIAFFVPNEG